MKFYSKLLFIPVKTADGQVWVNVANICCYTESEDRVKIALADGKEIDGIGNITPMLRGELKK